jgi:hypothetical protein
MPPNPVFTNQPSPIFHVLKNLERKKETKGKNQFAVNSNRLCW